MTPVLCVLVTTVALALPTGAMSFPLERVPARGAAATAGGAMAVASSGGQSQNRAQTEKRRRPSRTEASVTDRVEVTPGSIVRWSVPGTRRCGMAGRRWRAVQETCYYPIDVERRPGAVTVSRHGVRGTMARAQIVVVAPSFGSQQIELGDIPQAHPSAADLRRNRREQARLTRLWSRAEGTSRFTLPLGNPLTPLPPGEGFGAEWIFNTTPPSSETHAGRDYAVKAGTPVAAVADGTVVLADSLFYSGNSVIVDHGNGLFSAYLHLAEVGVRAGQDIRRGDRVGLVGDTGRATGPHLHLAIRWHRARVDPRLLLQDPAEMPAITGRK